MHPAFHQIERDRREQMILDLIRRTIETGGSLASHEAISDLTGLSKGMTQGVILRLKKQGRIIVDCAGPKRRYWLDGKWSAWSQVTHVRLRDHQSAKSKVVKPCISRISQGCTGLAPDYPVIWICDHCKKLGASMTAIEAGSSGRRVGASSFAARAI